jgi:hypothetical protein
MITHDTSLRRDKQLARQSVVSYFGLAVEVLIRMEHCSVIRYQDREFVVSTEDLQDLLAIGCVA